MANDCAGVIRACAMRVAELDGSGVPNPGAQNLYVTDQLVELTATPNVVNGPEIRQDNACGEAVVSVKSDDLIDRYNIELTIATPDPELTHLLVGGLLETDADPAFVGATGYGAPQLNVNEKPNGVSIELWSQRITDGALDPEFPYLWTIWPRVKSMRLGPMRWFNGVQTRPFVGNAIENANWFDGPLNDWPISSDRAFHQIETKTIPDTVCGYQSIVAS